VFRLFTPLFSDFDRFIASIAGVASQRVMTAITPVIEASLILWFMWTGILVMRGAVHEPIVDFIWKIVRTSLILSVALGAGYYQSTVGELVRTVPDDLAQAVMGDEAHLYDEAGEPVVLGPSSSGVGALIDIAAGKGIVASMTAMRVGSLFEWRGAMCVVLGVVLFLATLLMVAIGGANVLVAKLVLGALVAVGPLFIASLLFESTRRFFERWTAMVVTYGLVLVLFAVFFTFMLEIFERYVSQIAFDGNANVGYAVGGAVVIAIVSVLTVWEAKIVAMGLGGGVALPRWIHGHSWVALMRSGRAVESEEPATRSSPAKGATS